jgi:hypothetical protein
MVRAGRRGETMLILVPFKPVAIVLGCLNALIFCDYFISY